MKQINEYTAYIVLFCSRIARSMMSKLICSTFLPIALAVLLFASRPAWTQDQTQDNVEDGLGNSQKTLANLYAVIRNVALPPPSADAKGTEPVTQRLVLLLPGKVLNYYDYFPGDAYQASLEDPHHDGQQVRVLSSFFHMVFTHLIAVSKHYDQRHFPVNHVLLHTHYMIYPEGLLLWNL